MNPYQLLFGSLWPTAPKHEPVPEPASLIELTPEDGGRKPNAWYRNDFQNNCINLLPALQGLHSCGYIHSTETVQGRVAWFITEKGNDYLKK